MERISQESVQKKFISSNAGKKRIHAFLFCLTNRSWVQNTM